jgi:hypothetical protein
MAGTARIVAINETTAAARTREFELLSAYRDQLRRELTEVERRLEPFDLSR